MNWNIIEGNWKQLKGRLKESWAKLTDKKLTSIAGKKDRLMGVLQEKYGATQEAVEKKDLKTWQEEKDFKKM